MPFIDSKVTMELSKEKRETIKSELGKAVSILGKGESFLMVGFEDNYDLYFGGNALELGAFVSVKVFGQVDSASSERFTAEVCRIYKEQLGIPGDAIYITYQGFSDWGWNGRNF